MGDEGGGYSCEAGVIFFLCRGGMDATMEERTIADRRMNRYVVDAPGPFATTTLSDHGRSIGTHAPSPHFTVPNFAISNDPRMSEQVPS